MKKAFVFFGVVAALAAATLFLYYHKFVSPPAQPRTVNESSAPAQLQSQAHSTKNGNAQTAAGGPMNTAALSPEAQAAIRTLEEILASKNDNDPRLDTQFRALSAATKAALRQKYSQLTPEDRNGRGTIVFLLGREISRAGDASDLDFFREVMNEPPCLSLSDCSKEMPATRGGDGHGEMGTETTLAYPQIVDLVSLDRLISSKGADTLAPGVRDAAWKIIEAAKASPVPLVARRAAELEKKLRK